MIPWVGGAFRAFIIGLWHSQTLYRFATYTGARIEKLAIREDRVEWVVRDRSRRLEMLAHRTHSGVLRAPRGADMGGRVPESLQATVEVHLSTVTRDGERTIFEGSGRNAGLEVKGRIDQVESGRAL